MVSEPDPQSQPPISVIWPPARDGDPNHMGLPTWDRYDLARRQTMIMDEPARMEDDPRGAERRLFATIPYIQPGT